MHRLKQLSFASRFCSFWQFLGILEGTEFRDVVAVAQDFE